MIAPWGSLLFGLAGIRSAPIILDALILGPDSSPGEPGSHMCSVAVWLVGHRVSRKAAYPGVATFRRRAVATLSVTRTGKGINQ